MSNLPDGADAQKKAFERAEKQGTGLLHTDFSQLKEGDLVFRLSVDRQGNILNVAEHVMIATGRVKIDKEGNVIAFEIIHSPGYGFQVEKTWRSVNTAYRIGHTRRDLDLIMGTYVSEPNTVSWNSFRNFMNRYNLWGKVK